MFSHLSVPPTCRSQLSPTRGAKGHVIMAVEWISLINECCFFAPTTSLSRRFIRGAVSVVSPIRTQPELSKRGSDVSMSLRQSQGGSGVQ